MSTLAFALPTLPGLPDGPKTYAAWPVWHDSTTKEVRFQPMPKKAATKLWHRARDFDRQTKRKDRHGGALGHAALQVLHALIFDRLNFASGRLDPSHAEIARNANVCERTVRNALNRLRDLGILNWVRRCRPVERAGGFIMEQISNAYALLPESQWRGYRPPPECPPPAPGTWGDHPALPSVIEQAIAERREGGGMRSVIRILASDAGDGLAGALAKLGRAMQARNPQ